MALRIKDAAKSMCPIKEHSLWLNFFGELKGAAKMAPEDKAKLSFLSLSLGFTNPKTFAQGASLNLGNQRGILGALFLRSTIDIGVSCHISSRKIGWKKTLFGKAAFSLGYKAVLG